MKFTVYFLAFVGFASSLFAGDTGRVYINRPSETNLYVKVSGLSRFATPFSFGPTLVTSGTGNFSMGVAGFTGGTVSLPNNTPQLVEVSLTSDGEFISVPFTFARYNASTSGTYADVLITTTFDPPAPDYALTLTGTILDERTFSGSRPVDVLIGGVFVTAGSVSSGVPFDLAFSADDASVYAGQQIEVIYQGEIIYTFQVPVEITEDVISTFEHSYGPDPDPTPTPSPTPAPTPDDPEYDPDATPAPQASPSVPVVSSPPPGDQPGGGLNWFPGVQNGTPTVTPGPDGYFVPATFTEPEKEDMAQAVEEGVKRALASPLDYVIDVPSIDTSASIDAVDFILGMSDETQAKREALVESLGGLGEEIGGLYTSMTLKFPNVTRNPTLAINLPAAVGGTMNIQLNNPIFGLIRSVAAFALILIAFMSALKILGSLL